MNERRTVVVGAGIIGLATAYHLARRGKPVLVLDAGAAGSGCSRANAGWVVPQTTAPLAEPGIVGYAVRSLGRPTSPVYLRPHVSVSFVEWLWKFWRASNPRTFEAGRRALVTLGRDTVSLFHELHSEAPFVINATESLRVFPTMAAARDASRSLRYLDEMGLPADNSLLSAREARDLEPILSARAGGALLMRNELQVDPASVCDALVSAISARGGVVLEGRRATGMVRTERTVSAVRTEIEKFDAADVVVAAGAASADLVRGLGVRIPLEVGKGYSFTVDLDAAPRRMIDLADAKIGLAPHAGATRVVGTMELSGPNARVDPRRIRAMIRAAERYVEPWPSQVSGPATVADVWVGQRPMLSDGLPVIDRVGAFDNLYLSTGHSMMGVSLGLSSGRALADYLVDGSKPGLLEPFSFTRLARRRPAFVH